MYLFYDHRNLIYDILRYTQAYILSLDVTQEKGCKFGDLLMLNEQIEMTAIVIYYLLLPET